MRLRGLLFLVFFLLALWPASAVHAEERWNKDIEEVTPSGQLRNSLTS